MSTVKAFLFPFVVIAAMSFTHVRANISPLEGIAAVTSPSADVTLSFVQPGRIAGVLIKEGQNVKAGQLLVQQDDAAEQALLLQLKAKSEDTTQIEAADASLAQKKVDLKRLEWAASRGAATDLEVEHARLDVKIAELSLKVAQVERKQNELKYNESKIRVDNMSLKSPITGTIDRVDVEVGESVNGLADVVRAVKTDPLWITLHVPLAKGRSLEVGQSVNVKFPYSNKKSSEGRVIYVSTVADAGSSTLRARVEVSNKSNRPAGEHVRVVLSPPAKSAYQ